MKMERKERKLFLNKSPPYSFLRGKLETQFTLQPDKHTKKMEDKKCEIILFKTLDIQE